MFKRICYRRDPDGHPTIPLRTDLLEDGGYHEMTTARPPTRLRLAGPEWCDICEMPALSQPCPRDDISAMGGLADYDTEDEDT